MFWLSQQEGPLRLLRTLLRDAGAGAIRVMSPRNRGDRPDDVIPGAHEGAMSPVPVMVMWPGGVLVLEHAGVFHHQDRACTP
jgi:hypothetical protein